MPRRELRATMKLQSETETQRNILKGEMNMLFQTESGQTVGPIGQGTWYLGEDPDRFDAECSALRCGKRRLPVIPRERNGGVYAALAGNLSEGGNIHMTSTILSVLGAFGSIASIVSLVLYLHDKKK